MLIQNANLAPSVPRNSGLKMQEIFKAASFHQALHTMIGFKQATRARLSLGALAKRLKLSSAATLTNYLKGRRIPNTDLILEISKCFELSQLEEQYLLALAERDRAVSTGDEIPLVHYQVRLDALKRIAQTQQFELGQFEVFCSPLHFAIREILNLKFPPKTAEAIRAKLNFETTTESVSLALEQLLNVGLIELDPAGGYRSNLRAFETTNEIPNEALKVFHETSLSRAAKLIRTLPVEERYFVSEVFALNRSRLPEAKLLIEKFRKEFARLLECKVGEGDEVVQLNINLSPMTRRSAK